MKKLIIGLLIATPPLFFAGCSMDGLLTRKLLTPVVATNQVPELVVTNIVYRTNLVHIPAVTNTVNFTNYVTPAHVQQILQPVETVTVLPAHSVVVTNSFVPAPVAVDAAQGIGTAVNTFAPGVGGIVGLGLSGLLSVFAAYQTRKAGNHQAAAETLGKAIEQARVALQASGPSGKEIAERFTDVITGHADSAGAAVCDIIEAVAAKVGGETTAAVALQDAAGRLNKRATAEELVEAAKSRVIPDWFSAAERIAVQKIQL